MTARLNSYSASPEGLKAMMGLENYLKDCGLEPKLIHLVKMRASQINGCAYCLDMHSRDARKVGETEQRLYVLPGWRETKLFTPRERAALAWTDALTLIAGAPAPDTVYEELRRHFSDKEIVDLTTLIGMINLWNRLAIAMGYEHPMSR